MPDTVKIKEAEVAIKQFVKTPQCIPALLEQMTRSQQPQARQLAAILLRQRLPKHVKTFDQPAVEHVRQAVLDHIVAEPMHNIRTSIAGVVAVLASATVIIDKQGNRSGGLELWPQLLGFVAACANAADNENTREVGFVVLEQICEATMEDLQPHLATLNGLFLHALTQEPAQKVQDAALKCVSALLLGMAMEDEVVVFKDLVGVLLNKCRERLAAAAAAGFQDEALLGTVGTVLEVLCDVTMSPHNLINPHIEAIVPLCLEVLGQPAIAAPVREGACLLLNGLAEAKPKQLAKKGNAPQLLLRLTQIIAAQEGSASGELFTGSSQHDEDSDDDDEEEERDSGGMAQTVLDTIALNVPTKYTFQAAMHIIGTFIAQPDPRSRKAAMALLAVMAEGCQVPLSEALPELMPQVVRSCGDPDQFVRQSACFALGQIAEHCQPEVFGYHEEILPAVFNLFDDPTTQVKGMSCYVLEMFCENLEPETLRPFLEPLMTKLVQTLQTHPKKSIQEMVLAAMAAIAVGAEDSFLPFFKPVADMLVPLLGATADDQLPLRGRGLECMGHFAVAVKREAFRPYLPACLQSAGDNLRMPAEQGSDLAEYSYAFFANIARVLEEEFTPYLADLVPHLCGVLNEADGNDIEKVEVEGGEGGLANFAADSDDSDDEDNKKYQINVRTGELEKRKACLTALGAMAQFTGAGFAPHLEGATEAITSCCGYWNGMVREEAALTLPQLVACCDKAFPSGNGEKWTKGRPEPLSPQSQTLGLACLEQLVELIEGEYEKEVVAKAVEAVEVILGILGPSLLQAFDATKLMNLTMQLLNQQTPCQEATDDEDEDGAEGEVTDFDHVLIENVGDLIGAYAALLGDAFLPFFDGFIEALKNYLNASRPANDRLMAVGCVAECVKHFDSREANLRYFETMKDTLKLALADGNYSLRRNAAYCVGVFCENTGGGAAGAYPELLQALSPLFQEVPNTDGAAADNAAAAVCRMVSSAPGAVPLEQVLPAVLGALPLKADMSENRTVYKCLAGLLSERRPPALAALAQILGVYAHGLASAKVDEETKGELRGLVAAVLGGLPEAAAACGQLPADAQAALAAAAQHQPSSSS